MDMAMRAPRTRRRARQAGFSIIEVLIAAAILLIITIGILPMFTRAVLSNVSGGQSTLASNYGKTQIETLAEKPFGDTTLTLVAGSTQLMTTDYWTQGSASQIGDANEGFTTTPTASGRGLELWQRTTRIQQFNVFDLATPLDGAAVAGNVHVKAIQVTLTPAGGAGPLSRTQGTTFTYYKSF